MLTRAFCHIMLFVSHWVLRFLEPVAKLVYECLEILFLDTYKIYVLVQQSVSAPKKLLEWFPV